MREDTSQFCNFEVEVLSMIYGRQELCLHGLARAPGPRFQAAPTSLLTLQTCGRMRRRTVLWGTSNEFTVCTAVCVRMRWSAVRAVRALPLMTTSPADTSVATSLSEHEEERRGCNADRHKSLDLEGGHG